MKICKCRKCQRPFEMPDSYLGTILCEDCDPHMDGKNYMRCKCCGSFIEKEKPEKPKVHPLDEMIKGIVLVHKAMESVGDSFTFSSVLEWKLNKLRYESIKWAYEDYGLDKHQLNERLRCRKVRDWIVKEEL